MRSSHLSTYNPLFFRLTMAVMLFQFTRVIFAFKNPDTICGSWSLLYAGLRYDIATACMLLSPLILLTAFPSRMHYSRWHRTISSFLFVLPISLSLLLNLVDAAWFPFTQKRSTFDILDVITQGNDLEQNIGQYLIDYWYLCLTWLASLALLFINEKRIYRNLSFAGQNPEIRPSLMVRTLIFVAIIGTSIIGFRGGLQLKPLSVQAAASMVPAPSIPLVLNTPFCILKSLDDELLKEAHYMTEAEATRHFQLHRPPAPLSRDSFNRMNVVVLILESFSFDYVSYYHPGKNYTPFLDSLMRTSATWPNCFANSKRSIEGIPAVLSAMPSWMDEAFITSGYNVTRIHSLASLLKPYGYSSAFFHGGNNGTMGFDHFAKLSGYEKYYGRKEYDRSEKDYDGQWGIYDHAYLDFMQRTLSTTAEPFHAAFFSVSSHHPYKIPEQFVPLAPGSLDEVRRAAWYTDHSLRLFFASARRQAWFKNTLFVITSDHSGPSASTYTARRLGGYHVPLLFYMPTDGKPAIHEETAQQTDILPSVLHLLGCKAPYTALGRNLFGTDSPWSINHANGIWALITDQYILQTDGERVIDFYTRKDSLMQHPVKPLPAEGDTALHFTQALLQHYRNGLIHNTLVRP